jgi:trehalose 6-phosphate synthase/phosphatase
MYVDRLPGSFVEEKSFALAWHYRKADPQLASIRAKELLELLMGLTANIDVQVLQGNRVIEVKNAGVNKGVAALHWIGEEAYDFVLALGDDWTDEDLFRAMPGTAYSIKVGLQQSHARFNLRDQAEVVQLLEELARQPVPAPV